MQQYFFDLFSSRAVQNDLIGDNFADLSEARKMARVILLDYAQHCFPNGEECLVVCKVRTASPERYYLTSLALFDETVTVAGYESSIPEQASTGGFDEGEVAYRMSPDWTDMRELRSDGFLKNVSAADGSWFMDYIPPEERPRVAAAIDRAIRLRAPFSLEHKVVRADDTVGWAASRALPVVDEHGRISEWIGVAKDVTAMH